jgi:sulfur-oxidizing protein SoxX
MKIPIGGTMRVKTIILAIVVAFSSASFAETTAPGKIKFGENGEIELALTGTAGDAATGRKLFMNRKKGNCLACHVNSDMAEQTFHGEVGPELDGVAERWNTAELRGILVNSKKMFEGTIMPAFYRDSGYNRILKKFDGKTILSAQEVEDLLAYVATLK